jgi:hypothetical protein
MRTATLFTLFVIFITQGAIAGDDYNRAEEFKARELLLIGYVESPESIAELTASNAEKYKADIALYNANIQAAFKEHWADKPQSFKLQPEAVSLTAEELLNYVVLTSDIKEIEGIEFFVFTLNTIYFETNRKGVKSYLDDTRSFRVSLENTVPTKADFLFLITKLKMYFKEEPAFDRANLEELLASKTLLVNAESTEMSEAEIKEVYPFPFKFSSTEEVFAAANNRDANTLYMKMDIEFRESMELINFMIIECETGRIISRCHITGLTKVTLNESSNHHQAMQAYFDAEAGRPNSFIGTGYGHVGAEIATLYLKKAELKATQFKYFCSEKKQLKAFKNLVIY